MDIRHLSGHKYRETSVWMLLAAAAIIITFALLARASLNLHAALTDKPDLAVMILLPEEDITEVTLLRDQEQERDYLVTTKEDGIKFVKLRKIGGEWKLAEVEKMHVDE